MVGAISTRACAEVTVARRRIRALRALIVGAVWLFSAHSEAQTNTYQNRLVGLRALGLGGAFTAAADDPSAAYYNPAALTSMSSNQLEVGLPVLAFDHVRIFRGLVPSASTPRDANSFGLAALPTMLGVAAGLGKRDDEGRQPIVFGASVLIPYHRQLAFKQALQDSDGSAFHLVQENEQTTMIGGSVAFRINEFSVGASLYYVHQTAGWLNVRSGTDTVCGSVACTTVASYNENHAFDAWAGAINPRLGLLYQPNKKLSLGLNISFSSYKIMGAASLRSSSAASTLGGLSEPVIVQTGRISFDRPQPWEARLGVAYRPMPRLLLSLDISGYAPERFTMIRGIAQPQTIYPTTIRRRFTMNVNLGFEFMLKRYVPLRFGLFTNTSSSPQVELDSNGQSTRLETRGCDSTACQEVMNHGGATVSLGMRLWKFTMDFGLYASYGRGYRQQRDLLGARPYSFNEQDHVQVNFFIGGNLGKVIDETANELMDRIETRLTDDGTKDTKKPSDKKETK